MKTSIYTIVGILDTDDCLVAGTFYSLENAEKALNILRDMQDYEWDCMQGIEKPYKHGDIMLKEHYSLALDLCSCILDDLPMNPGYVNFYICRNRIKDELFTGV